MGMLQKRQKELLAARDGPVGAGGQAVPSRLRQGEGFDDAGQTIGEQEKS